MRWFRANRKLGGQLALLALAVQLILSFGHIHADDNCAPALAAASSAGTIALPKADQPWPLPSNRPANHTDDYCAICATIYLLSASSVAEAPQLSLRLVSDAIEHVDLVAVAFVAPQRAPFQSRAPPLA
jgi:hypothetical protein